MGLVKANALINNREKELLKVSIHGQKRGTFLGKEVLQDVRKVLQKEMQKGNAIFCLLSLADVNKLDFKKNKKRPFG